MDTRAARGPKRPTPTVAWECDRCLLETGVASTMTMKVRKGGHIDVARGKIRGGVFFEVCALCLSRGKTTIVCEA